MMTIEELARQAAAARVRDFSTLNQAADAREAIARLATLPPLEYALVRNQEAAKLGLPKPLLDAEVTKTRTGALRMGPTADTFERWLLDYCRRAQTSAVTMTEVLNLGPYPLRRKHLVEPILFELSKIGKVRLKKGPGKTRLIEINTDLLASDNRYAAFL